MSSDIFKMSDDLLWYAIYGAISLWAFFYYYHVITQPDTFNYLIISEDFLYGRVHEGINSMWGSLITIFIVPFLAVGFLGLTAFKIVQIIVGFFTLHVFLKFLNRFHFSFLWKVFAVIPILPLTVLGTVILTPDLLLLTATLYYVFLVSKYPFFDKKQAVKIGIAGGLMYWSKSYGFPFFAAHFTALNGVIMVYFFYSKKNMPYTGWKPVLRYTLVMFIFLLISSLWIAAISYKTGQVTIGTAGKYNIALKGSVMNDIHLTKNELLNPNTPYTKYWIYHEAGLFVEAWNPFASAENRRHFATNFKGNLSSLYYVSFVRDLLILLMLCSLMSVFIWWKNGRKIQVNQKQIYFIGVAILACAVYTGGYLLVFIQQRYLWLTFVLLWLVFLLLLKNIRSKTQDINPNLVLIWLVLSSLMMSVNHLDRLREMTKDRHFFAHLNEVSEVLHPFKLEGKNIAANNVKGNMISVDADIYLLYQHRFDYWGQLANKKIEGEGFEELYNKNIDYFFCWDSPGFERELSAIHPRILRDSVINLSIYQMKK